MEKDNSRELKRAKDKQHKRNTTMTSKYIPPKSKSLASNWDRYEKENDEQEFQLSGSTDFSILASAPITKGHHFQFKSDKFIAEEIEDKISTALFSLNLNLLKQSICTVPFYHRVGIDVDYFSENQLKFMNRDAELKIHEYNERYTKEVPEESNECAPNEDTNKDQSTTDDAIVASKQQNVVDNSPKLREEKKEDMPKRLDDDLEQWLDNILDD